MEPHDSERHCLLEDLRDTRLSPEIPRVVAELAASCGTRECLEHIGPTPIPDQGRAAEVVELARELIFPGYFSSPPVERVNLEYHLGQVATRLFEVLSDQVTHTIRHDCFRYELACRQCRDRGKETAAAFLGRLPGLRQVLAADVRAAREGDPAAQSLDEIIFSYPGLYAVLVHRLAHALWELEVPLLPRMLGELAHGKTGIDIHPGAEIGESFFIDHGTGVVIGETSVIGRGVRIYQGVTLGAHSLPPGAGDKLRQVKRHPTIEEEVIIYSGATILGGDTVIGARSVIGGNVWLTESVPPGTRVFLKRPELVYKGNHKED
jgi:serine O-acetyltransferase